MEIGPAVADSYRKKEGRAEYRSDLSKQNVACHNFAKASETILY